MDTSALFADLAHRPAAAAAALPMLTPEVLNGHPGGHPNSPAWLLWHAARQMDVQLAQLTGGTEVWADGWRDRLCLGPAGDGIGYGDSPDDAARIVSDDQEGLTGYLIAACSAAARYAGSLRNGQWAEIIDDSYDPPVTRATRLVSILYDAAQHVGQVAYVAGMSS
ncbi:aspartate/tyrosine/aromatic aminotransferase [Corynebacterium sp. CCM 9185]|uniref:Aspartate/tyrosine/aromatic aminotransferase n=1 Tax=Corynebacterium marambiense TaxID=2765364 RepID=A0ABS0VSN8_9CORY|nr:DinB family protein [Corynebacterium marambiense]MBI8999785.1 aspartate/tyrosine/aromatic aminotransferase [Corynebacterium marambiense]MCK7662625.1 aspartate/tyrosine/aromatic aminotransferase [Corynebacterium marambiense]